MSIQALAKDNWHNAITSTGQDNAVLRVLSSRLQEQALRFMEGFPGLASYAVKANDHPDIIRNFVQSGMTAFDVASLHEIEIVRSVAPHARLHYHNPVRSSHETAMAIHKHDCRRFAIDHGAELEKIFEFAPEPSAIEIAVRFRDTRPSKAVQEFKSKFGALPLQAAKLLQRAKALGFKVGLTFHPGSQTTDVAAYEQHIETAAGISKTAGTRLGFLNVGGGFPGHYTKMETPEPEDFFSAIETAAKRHFGAFPPALECEPGRALVGPAGYLNVPVKAVRREEKELFLADGIYGGLMEVHQFPELQPKYSTVKRKTRSCPQDKWTAYGPTCDPVDVLPFKLVLPEAIEEGNIITFAHVGAYSTATATRFNGYGGIEVRVE